jgi:hypothetical protein
MVNKTPLRLVALEETPPVEVDDVEDAAPDFIMTEHDAITRKVPESEAIAAADSVVRPTPKSFQSWKVMLLIAAAALGVVIAALAMAGRGKVAPPSVPAPAAASAVSPAALPTSQPRPAPVVPAAPAAPAVAAVAPAEAKAVPETIRLEITAEPVEAELSLDGNVLAGHRLNLDVPKDRGIHILSASAPGYVPFNQQVSFSSDVILTISLRRGHTPVARPVFRPRAPQSEARAKVEVRSAPVPSDRGMEPGMNLEGPSLRPAAKAIDERNPYKP